MTYFIDPEDGRDENPGTIESPRATRPPLAHGDTWLFARGSVLDLSLAEEGSMLIRPPTGESYPWELTIGAYDRPGENGAPKPLVLGDPDIQHTVTFMDVVINISGIEIHGGFGSALRILTKNYTLDAPVVRDCTLRSKVGKGLIVSSGTGGTTIKNALFENNYFMAELENGTSGASDGFHFMAGIVDCVIKDNVSQDSAHTSFYLYSAFQDRETSHGNRFINNVATGHNSTHCRGVTISGYGGTVYGNDVIGQRSTGMTASDKIGGVNTRFIDCESDFGITATSTSALEAAGNVCRDSVYPDILVIARHGEVTRGATFRDVSGVRHIMVEEQSEGKCDQYLFDHVQVTEDAVITVRDQDMTPLEANQLPGFNLIQA